MVGFTPILSAFPYTAGAVEAVTETVTYTQYDTEEYVTNPSSTVTSTITSVDPEIIYASATTTIPGTSTLTLYEYTDLGTSTGTRTPVATHFAICDEDSGNYVDHFPWGQTFSDGLAHIDSPTSGHTYLQSALDPNSFIKYFKEILEARDRVECCNRALADPLTAAGYWQPNIFGGILGNNICYVYKVKDAESCRPADLQYTIETDTYNRFNGTGYYAL